MLTRDLLRLVVIKSDRFWPFRVLNRSAYGFATAAFVALCRTYPCVKSVYLRHALHGENFRPGLSDIDLTVVIDATLERRAEYCFLRSFWQRAALLSRLFPMIGEIEILNRSHLESWSRFGPEGRKTREWRLLHGVETVVDVPPATPARYSVETLNQASWFYIWHMARELGRERRIAFLSIQDTLRVQRKISRHLAELGVEASPEESRDAAGDHATIVLRTLGLLEAGVATLGTDAVPPPSRRVAWLLERVRPRPRPVLEPPVPLDFESWKDVVRSVYLDKHRGLFVILKDSASSQRNHQFVDWIRAMLKGEDTLPLILSRDLLAYLVRFLFPYEHAHFVKDVGLLFGDDLVEEIQVPGDDCLLRELIAYTPLALTFATGETLMRGTVRDPAFTEELVNALKRTLGLKLYLERGIGGWISSQPFERYYAAYPNQAGDIQALLADLSRGHCDRWRWFALMRNLTDDIHAALSTNTSWEHDPLPSPGD